MPGGPGPMAHGRDRRIYRRGENRSHRMREPDCVESRMVRIPLLRWRGRVQHMHISSHEPSQMFLLPEAVDDYVGADNPVRFIEAFVDKLDLTAAGFVRREAEATGRPGYAPADLLKLYIYGYLKRLRLNRRLEMETCRNIEVIWLPRRLMPDFKTIAEFRLDNRAALRLVFREFVLHCRCLDLYGRESLVLNLDAHQGGQPSRPAPSSTPSASTESSLTLVVAGAGSLELVTQVGFPLRAVLRRTPRGWLETVEPSGAAVTHKAAKK
jgi:transposase